MNKFLSLIFLYNRASYKKILLILGAIPLCFLAIFLLRIGNPYETSSYMLMERAFGGVWAVLVLIAVNLLGLISVVNSLNGKKALKAAHSTTGYTMRRLHLSPISSYLTIFVYYLAMILIFWGAAIASLYAIGKLGLVMTGATGIDTKLALGLLRTKIGSALIPISHPTVIAFNIVSVLALAGECARSCYLSWHNGTPSAGVVLVIVPMFLIWTYTPESSYTLIAIMIIIIYALFCFGDVLSREKRPKGDPFKVNKYAGLMDLDSDEFDDSVHLAVNSPALHCDSSSSDTSLLQRYGRAAENVERKGLKFINPGWLRRRFMPLGINMEKSNALFGGCIFVGFAGHLLFFGRYLLQLNVINNSIKGITIDSGLKMPYFWELQQHTYYGYIIAILLVLFIQAYWNYAYYNKETKSVYVMKRLPDRKEYQRTIWISPVIEALSIAGIMVAHTVIDLLMYAVATPGIALYPDYLSHILPF